MPQNRCKEVNPVWQRLNAVQKSLDLGIPQFSSASCKDHLEKSQQFWWLFNFHGITRLTQCKPISVNNSLKRTLTSNWSHTILPFDALVKSTTCVPLWLQYLTSEGSLSHGWPSGPGFRENLARPRGIHTLPPSVLRQSCHVCGLRRMQPSTTMEEIAVIKCCCEKGQKEDIDCKAFLVYFFVNSYKHRLVVSCVLLTCLAVAQAPP